MPISQNELNEALNRAAYLMSEQGQNQIKKNAQSIKNNFDINGDYQKQYVNHQSPNIIQEKQTHINHTSKLPKVIQESLTKNPINFQGETSVIDNLSINTQNKNMVMEQQTPVQPYQPQYQPQYQAPQMMIDYNYLRSIINECIQLNMQKIKEEILSESELKAIRLGSENKIQLIDNKNNLYESKLIFKKNITKK